MLGVRSAMNREEIVLSSAVITEKLLSLECVLRAKSVMAYYSHRNEPDLLEFMRRCIDMGKRVSLPCVSGKGEMAAAAYCSDTVMKNNVYGIPEPVITGETREEEPDIVIVPGVAFDERLYRIGFGKGYYDRFLVNTQAVKAGVCFDFQIVPDIGAQSHDVPMDIIITEKRILGGQRCG